MNGVKGTWAFVTGASSGIGEAVARRLAGTGMSLVLAARRAERLETLAAELRQAHGVEVRVVVVDLGSPGALEVVIAATQDVDVALVVSNAGFAPLGPLLAEELGDARGSLHLNAGAHLELAHHFGRRLRERGGGGLLLVSSLGAFQGMPWAAGYGAAKAYVLCLGEALHHELAGSGVHVTVVAPGPTETEAAFVPGTTHRIAVPFGRMSADAVARQALAALARNRTICIPGLANRLMAALVPRAAVVRMLGGTMRSAHEAAGAAV